MTVLGVDTSSPRASVAIVAHGQLLAELSHPRVSESPSTSIGKSHHAEVLLSLIHEALGLAGLSVSVISGFALAAGPGSFTGLRIGLSTIKGLVYGWRVPVLGLSTLEAWALLPRDSDRLVCSVLDARKSEYYAALFRRRAGFVERITADEVLPLERIIGRLKGVPGAEPVVFVGDPLLEQRDRLQREIKRELLFAAVESLPTVASAVALLGEAALAKPADVLCLSGAPRYLRRPEAEEKARKLA